MSLQDVICAHQTIVQEQAAIRQDLQNFARTIEQQYKAEIQRLMRRLDENEARVAKLGGDVHGAGGGGGGSARNMPAKSNMMAKTVPPVFSANGGQGMAKPVSERSLGYGASAVSTPSMMQRPNRPGMSTVTPGSMGQTQRQREEKLDELKAVAVSAVKQAASTGSTWEEPAECKASSAAIDRFEAQLKASMERNREFARYANNPIQGVQLLFNRLDKNHSGKVDKSELMNLGRILEFHMSDDKILDGLFARYDIDRNGYITIDEFARSMFKLDGDTEFKAKSTIARMREVLSLRAGGFESMKALGTQFRIMDRNRDERLSKEEYDIALDCLFTAYHVKFTQAEKNALFKLFDRDQEGFVNYDEFVRGIRGDMSDFRLNWVKQAFQTLDTDGSGVVTMGEMSRTYDVSQNPAVQSGKITPEEAMRQFMKHYDANMDGQITFEEFVENYQWVSASIDSDDYFELMMRNAWHITGGEGWSANTSNLRVLVKHSNGGDEVVEVRHDLGLPHDPAKKYQEVIRRLSAQGVKDIKKIEFFG